MRHFTHKNGELHAEDVPLRTIAESVGTPVYVYSRATLERHFRVFRDSFAGVGRDVLVAFAVKANSNLAVLKLLGELGAGADVVSGGELARALAAGIPPGRIVFSGVGKRRDEMRAALSAGAGEGIRVFNVESVPELRVLDEEARKLGTTAPIAFRINPDVAAGANAKIMTGTSEKKFGIPWRDAREAYAEAARLPGIRVVGVDVHIGSQIDALAPYEAAITRVGELIGDLRADGHAIQSFDLGGGLGIPYGDGSVPPLPAAYGEMVTRLTDGLDVDLIFEPGRMIAGNAGVLVSRVEYVKPGEGRTFLVLDAAMNDLIRPALYGSHHEIEPVKQAEDSLAPTATYDVVGPVCESGDTFAKAREMGRVAAGDLVAFHSAGAYGAVQASTYNTRPLVPEVLVDGDRWEVIRRRMGVDDLLALDSVPAWV